VSVLPRHHGFRACREGRGLGRPPPLPCGAVPEGAALQCVEGGRRAGLPTGSTDGFGRWARPTTARSSGRPSALASGRRRVRVVHGLLGTAVLAGLLLARPLGPVRGAPLIPAPHVRASPIPTVAPSAVALEGAAGTAAQGAEGGTTGLGAGVVHRRAGALREGLAGSGAGTARAAPRPTGRPG